MPIKEGMLNGAKYAKTRKKVRMSWSGSGSLTSESPSSMRSGQQNRMKNQAQSMTSYHERGRALNAGVASATGNEYSDDDNEHGSCTSNVEYEEKEPSHIDHRLRNNDVEGGGGNSKKRSSYNIMEKGNNRSEKNHWRPNNEKRANAYISNSGKVTKFNDTQWRCEMSGERGKELERENEDLKRKIMELEEEAALTAAN